MPVETKRPSGYKRRLEKGRLRERNVSHIHVHKELNRDTRSELNRKFWLIRLQYHPVSRVLFEVCWRLMFMVDLVTDVSLILQFTPLSVLWCLFFATLTLPYILSAIVLFFPFHRRLLTKYKCSSSCGLFLILIIYAVLSLPCILLMDLYICTRLIVTDLATTRYLLYYWRLKLLVEQCFEAIPQTVLLILIGSGILEHDSTSERINVHLLYGSLSISVMCLLWYIMVIYYGAQSTGLSVMNYLWRYYIMQGIDMIPYQEAITQNLLSDFVLTSELLTVPEWSQLTKDIFNNFSIVRFDISGQQTLGLQLWCKLLEGLATNNLTTLRLFNCFMFHPDNVIEDKLSNRKSVTDAGSKMQLLRSGFQAMLLNVPSLVVVDLTGNCLHSAFRELVKPISKLTKLKELYLSKNRLRQSDMTEKEYHQLFRGCKSLIVLDLSDNFLNDDNVIMICAAMRKCKAKNQLKALRHLNFDENEISNAGATELFTIIGSFKSLSINLYNNMIDEKVFENVESQAAVALMLEDSDSGEV